MRALLAAISIFSLGLVTHAQTEKGLSQECIARVSNSVLKAALDSEEGPLGQGYSIRIDSLSPLTPVGELWNGVLEVQAKLTTVDSEGTQKQFSIIGQARGLRCEKFDLEFNSDGGTRHRDVDR